MWIEIFVSEEDVALVVVVRKDCRCGKSCMSSGEVWFGIARENNETSVNPKRARSRDLVYLMML